MKTRLLCMPTLCADIFDATGEILPGGEALNLACIACRYDHLAVSLLGAIGEDEPGRAILRAIDAGRSTAVTSMSSPAAPRPLTASTTLPRATATSSPTPGRAAYSPPTGSQTPTAPP